MNLPCRGELTGNEFIPHRENLILSPVSIHPAFIKTASPHTRTQFFCNLSNSGPSNSCAKRVTAAE
jgi:hypothetical protein